MTPITDFNPGAKRIEIPLSKSKLVKLLLIALCFGAGGFWFVMDPSAFTDNGLYHRPRLEIIIVGIITIGFFGIGGVSVFIAQLFNKRPGLIIDDSGITINPGLFSSNKIKWGDISKFEIVQIYRTRLINVFLNDTSDYSTTKKQMEKTADVVYL